MEPIFPTQLATAPWAKPCFQVMKLVSDARLWPLLGALRPRAWRIPALRRAVRDVCLLSGRRNQLLAVPARHVVSAARATPYFHPVKLVLFMLLRSLLGALRPSTWGVFALRAAVWHCLWTSWRRDHLLPLPACTLGSSLFSLLFSRQSKQKNFL